MAFVSYILEPQSHSYPYMHANTCLQKPLFPVKSQLQTGITHNGSTVDLYVYHIYSRRKMCKLYASELTVMHCVPNVREVRYYPALL